jgi:hypothetical protein
VRSPHAWHGDGTASSLDQISGNLRAARERTGWFEIEAIAERRTHFLLGRALHYETTITSLDVTGGLEKRR